MINHVYSWAYFPEMLISGGTQRSTCFKEPRLIWFRLSSQRMPLGEHSADIWLTSFCGKGTYSFQLYLSQRSQNALIEVIGMFKIRSFEVKVKLDPGAERKSSGNIFWLAAVCVYFRVFFLWRLWLGMILTWY